MTWSSETLAVSKLFKSSLNFYNFCALIVLARYIFIAWYKIAMQRKGSCVYRENVSHSSDIPRNDA